jgi:hypothetical protein
LREHRQRVLLSLLLILLLGSTSTVRFMHCESYSTRPPWRLARFRSSALLAISARKPTPRSLAESLQIHRAMARSKGRFILLSVDGLQPSPPALRSDAEVLRFSRPKRAGSGRQRAPDRHAGGREAATRSGAVGAVKGFLFHLL